VLFGGVGATRLADEPTYDGYVVSGSYPEPLPGLRSDGREISNIFPYDATGRPLTGVHLYDQDGVPLVATHEDNPELESRLPLDAAGDAVANRYPREQYQVDPATGSAARCLLRRRSREVARRGQFENTRTRPGRAKMIWP
jgi:hypothetical protein